MERHNKEVINYLTETLGLKSIFKTKDEVDQSYFAVFSVEMLGTYAPSEIELLEKMISSLMWSDKKCVVCDASQIARVKAKYKIHFVNSLENKNISSVTLQQHKEVFVPSPRILGLKPELKKQAWEQLKKALLWS